jgi:hypothetical protein
LTEFLTIRPGAGRLRTEGAEPKVQLGHLCAGLQYLEGADRSRLFAKSVAKVVADAKRRHRMTPFFVAGPGKQSFQICVLPPELVYEESGAGISLADAVMCLDVAKLLHRGKALV